MKILNTLLLSTALFATSAQAAFISVESDSFNASVTVGLASLLKTYSQIIAVLFF